MNRSNDKSLCNEEFMFVFFIWGGERKKRCNNTCIMEYAFTSLHRQARHYGAEFNYISSEKPGTKSLVKPPSLAADS